MVVSEINIISPLGFLESIIGSLYDLGERAPRGSSRSRMGLEMCSKDLSDVGIEGESLGFTSMGSHNIPFGSSSDSSYIFPMCHMGLQGIR